MNQYQPLSSHRIRAEERKLKRKMLITALFFIGFSAFIFLIGIPFIINLIAGIGNGKKVQTASNEKEELLFAPVLDPVWEATNTSKIRLSGNTEKNISVKIFVNDKQKSKVTSNDEGKFTVPGLSLDEGENLITASIERNDSESTRSSVLNIIYKKDPPLLEIEKPKDGDRFLSENREIEIKGQTDPDNRVTINGRFVIVNNDGGFSQKLKLSDGDNSLKFVALDNAGNRSEQEIKVNYLP
jgi:hypothetical protein